VSAHNVEVDAVQALDVQHRMTIQQLRNRDHIRRGNRLMRPHYGLRVHCAAPARRRYRQPRRSEASLWMMSLDYRAGHSPGYVARHESGPCRGSLVARHPARLCHYCGPRIAAPSAYTADGRYPRQSWPEGSCVPAGSSPVSSSTGST
jgi:hypothetical protein